MAKMRIQYMSKSGSLYGDMVEVDTTYVPRVGELITTSAEQHPYDLEGGTFMVLSVTSRHMSAGFEPHLTARQWHKGLRAEVLAAPGWLSASEDVERVYGEDDSGFPR